MSTYAQVRGLKIITDENPVTSNLEEGQLVVNTTSRVVQGVCFSASWTAGGAMGTARRYLAGAGASNTAALAFGGRTTIAVACTESYSVSGGVCQL